MFLGLGFSVIGFVSIILLYMGRFPDYYEHIFSIMLLVGIGMSMIGFFGDYQKQQNQPNVRESKN